MSMGVWLIGQANAYDLQKRTCVFPVSISSPVFKLEHEADDDACMRAKAKEPAFTSASRARALYRSFIARRVCVPMSTETHYYYRVCEVR
jgi:hypothetical protein